MMRQFCPGYEAGAARPFTFSGVKYAKGDRFPYRGLGIIDYDLRGLWIAELIDFTGKPYEPSEAELERMTAPRAQVKQPARR